MSRFNSDTQSHRKQSFINIEAKIIVIKTVFGLILVYLIGIFFPILTCKFFFFNFGGMYYDCVTPIKMMNAYFNIYEFSYF